MLVDIEFLLKEHLERCHAFFSEPSKENGGNAMEPERIDRVFGHEVLSHGIYCVGSPNMGNFLREVIPDGMRHSGAWCDHRDYGTASTVDEILAYARVAELEQACVVLIVPVDEIFEKSGPWIGPRTEDGSPMPGEVVLDWNLVPIDPVKLEAALAKRSESAPAP